MGYKKRQTFANTGTMGDQPMLTYARRILLSDIGSNVGVRVRVVGNVNSSTEGHFTLTASDGVASVHITIPEFKIDADAMPIVEVVGMVAEDQSVTAELVCPFNDFSLRPFSTTNAAHALPAAVTHLLYVCATDLATYETTIAKLKQFPQLA